MISSEKEVGPVAANILLAEDDRALSALIPVSYTHLTLPTT